MQSSIPKYFSSAQDYRYSYNGMEKDNEVSGNGNSYTTQFRQYDPRLGRWKSLDPLAGKYPGMSPFTAFNNNPIQFVDPHGLESTEPSDNGGGTKDNPHKVKGIDEAKSILDGIDNASGKTVYFQSGALQYSATYNAEKGQWDVKVGRVGVSDENMVDATPIKGGETNTKNKGNESTVNSSSTAQTTNSDIDVSSNNTSGHSEDNPSNTEAGQYQRIFTSEQGNVVGFFGVPLTLGQMTGNLSSFENLIADGEIVAQFMPETNTFGIFKNGVLTQTIDIPSGVNFQTATASLKAVKSLSITCKYVGGALSYLSIGMTIDLMLAEGVNVENALDLGMGFVGLAGPYGSLISAAYGLVLKPYFKAVSWGWSQIPPEHLQWAAGGKY